MKNHNPQVKNWQYTPRIENVKPLISGTRVAPGETPLHGRTKLVPAPDVIPAPASAPTSTPATHLATESAKSTYQDNPLVSSSTTAPAPAPAPAPKPLPATESAKSTYQDNPLVSASPPCTPPPSQPLKKGDRVIYCSNEYYFVPNGTTCYLYTDLDEMKNHNPQVKNWQYTPRIENVKPLISGTRVAPGETPLHGRTKLVPAPDVIPAPASAPTSTPATHLATESAKSTYQDNPLVSSSTTAPAPAPAPAPKPLPATESAKSTYQDNPLVSASPPCTPPPSQPLKKGDRVIYCSNEYYFVPNGTTCYLYTDLDEMKNHNPQVKNWQYTPRIENVKPLISGTRVAPGETPLHGRTKLVPAPDVIPAPASAPTSTPATHLATESAKSTYQDNPLVSSSTTAPAPAPAPAPKPLPATESAKSTYQDNPLVSASPPCTPPPSQPLKKGDRVIYCSNEYYFVPNGTTCYLYTDLDEMKNHNPQVKNWQYTPRIENVKPLISGTRVAPGETPLHGRTKLVPAPDVIPAPASAPTSTPATHLATESAKSTYQDNPLVSSSTTAPAPAPAPAPKPLPATESAKSTYQDNPLVSASPPCTPPPSQPLKKGDRVIYCSNEYYFVPNGTTCYLYTDLDEMKNHNPQVKNWQYTPRIENVKPLISGTRVAPGETPLHGRTKLVPAPDVIPAPASAPTSTPATHLATESAKSTYQDNPLVSSSTTAPAPAPAPAPKPLPATESAKSTYQDNPLVSASPPCTPPPSQPLKKGDRVIYCSNEYYFVPNGTTCYLYTDLDEMKNHNPQVKNWQYTPRIENVKPLISGTRVAPGETPLHGRTKLVPAPDVIPAPASAPTSTPATHLATESAKSTYQDNPLVSSSTTAPAPAPAPAPKPLPATESAKSTYQDNPLVSASPPCTPPPSQPLKKGDRVIYCSNEYYFVPNGTTCYLYTDLDEMKNHNPQVKNWQYTPRIENVKPLISGTRVAPGETPLHGRTKLVPAPDVIPAPASAPTSTPATHLATESAKSTYQDNPLVSSSTTAPAPAPAPAPKPLPATESAKSTYQDNPLVSASPPCTPPPSQPLKKGDRVIYCSNEYYFVPNGTTCYLYTDLDEMKNHNPQVKNWQYTPRIENVKPLISGTRVAPGETPLHGRTKLVPAPDVIPAPASAPTSTPATHLATESAKSTYQDNPLVSSSTTAPAPAPAPAPKPLPATESAKSTYQDNPLVSASPPCTPPPSQPLKKGDRVIYCSNEYYFVPNGTTCYLYTDLDEMKNHNPQVKNWQYTPRIENVKPLISGTRVAPGETPLHGRTKLVPAPDVIPAPASAPTSTPATHLATESAKSTYQDNPLVSSSTTAPAPAPAPAPKPLPATESAKSTYQDNPLVSASPPCTPPPSQPLKKGDRVIYCSNEYYFVPNGTTCYLYTDLDEMKNHNPQVKNWQYTPRIENVKPLISGTRVAPGETPLHGRTKLVPAPDVIPAPASAPTSTPATHLATESAKSTYQDNPLVSSSTTAPAPAPAPAPKPLPATESAKSTYQDNPLVSASPPCTPPPSQPLKKGDRVIYCSNEYYFVPNGTTCYLYTDLDEMKNHNPQVKNWQYTPRIENVKPLISGTRVAPGETPLHGRTKLVPAPDVIPAPASAPTSTPATHLATESAKSTYQDNPLVSSSTTAPAPAPAPAPKPLPATESAKSTYQDNPLVSASPPCTPPPSQPLKKGDRVIYCSNEYYFVPNGTTCYLYTDLDEMKNHNPQVKNWQYTPRIENVKPLISGTRVAPGETPLHGRTKLVPAPDVIPAPASAPTSTPATRLATESAKSAVQEFNDEVPDTTSTPVPEVPNNAPALATTSISQDNSLVSSSTTAPAPASASAPLRPTTESAKSASASQEWNEVPVSAPEVPNAPAPAHTPTPAQHTRVLTSKVTLVASTISYEHLKQRFPECKAVEYFLKF